MFLRFEHCPFLLFVASALRNETTMASGASGIDPAMDTSASPRQKRRGVGNTGPAPAPVSPGPRRYTPGPAATETEITLAEVVNNHASKIETITGILKIMNANAQGSNELRSVTTKSLVIILKCHPANYPIYRKIIYVNKPWSMPNALLLLN